MATEIVKGFFTPGTLCGCEVYREAYIPDAPTIHARGVALEDDVRAGSITTIAEYKQRQREISAAPWVPIRIVSQCDGHAAFATVEELYAEIINIHGMQWTCDTCGCVLHSWSDDRLAPDKRVATPVESERARRCFDHAHLTAAADHHAAVTAENRAVSVAKIAVAEALGWVPAVTSASGRIITPEVNPDSAPDRVPWAFDGSRQVVVDHAALGVTPSFVTDAIAAKLAQVQ